MCGVTEEDVQSAKAVTAMWVFLHVYMHIIREQVTFMECRIYTHEMCELFPVINMFINVNSILTILFFDSAKHLAGYLQAIISTD
jgi:hypothetical protein